MKLLSDFVYEKCSQTIMNSNKRSLPVPSRFQLPCRGPSVPVTLSVQKLDSNINELTSFKVFFSTIK